MTRHVVRRLRSRSLAVGEGSREKRDVPLVGASCRFTACVELVSLWSLECLLGREGTSLYRIGVVIHCTVYDVVAMAYYAAIGCDCSMVCTRYNYSYTYLPTL